MSTLEQQSIEQLERLLMLESYTPTQKTVAPSPTARASQLSPIALFILGAGVMAVVAYSVPLLQSSNPAQDPTQDPAQRAENPPQAIPSQFAIPGFSQPSAPVRIVSSTLSARKTTITGVVDPRTRSAALYLSMFLHNSGSSPEEATMTIKIPEGAAVSRATLWVNGRPQEAAFNTTERVTDAYERVTTARRDPLLITQVGPETIQVKASPVVPGHRGMKLRIGFTVPLEAERNAVSRLFLPALEDRNFNDGTLDVHLENSLTGALIRLHAKSWDSAHKSVDIASPVILDKFAVRATHSADGGFIVASLNRDAAEPFMTYRKVLSRPDCPVLEDINAEHRISTLWAKSQIEHLVSDGRRSDAARLAEVYRVVSSISGACVLENQNDYARSGLHRDQWRAVAIAGTAAQSETPLELSGMSAVDAPMLQGATNGTIGPQGMDATVISGVNTAGTIRVNNLANMEAALCVVANAAGPLAAAPTNYMVASARDANLFSGDDASTSFWGVVVCSLAALIVWSPLFALAYGGPVIVLKRWWQARSSGTSSNRLLLAALGWFAVAFLLPLVSQVAGLACAFTLWRRRQLRAARTQA